MEIGDEILVKGTVIDIDTNEPKIKVSTGGVASTWYYSDEIESLDKRIEVPGYVKNDLDEAFKGGLTSYQVANLPWDSKMSCWIKGHSTAFMHALVYGYKAEKVKKYNVKVPGKFYDDMYYFRNDDGKLATSWGKDGDDFLVGDWTLEQIKEYGLENFERVEVGR